ncbi:MAG: hypothetical protein U9R34_01315 [Nanoarchaeota archaeon]|nr:hypothetical protein [Nanoarchaeota archaeon]
MAEDDITKDLKDLSPAEKIKKLKELQEKERSMIKNAGDMIMQEQQELERQKKVREDMERISLPEPKKVDIRKLFTGDEGDNLESKVRKEKPELTEEELQAMRQYQIKMSQAPAQNIYQKVRDIQGGIEEKGYMNPSERVELNSIGYALDYKRRDINEGKYVTTSEMIEDFMGTAKSIIKYLRGED